MTAFTGLIARNPTDDYAHFGLGTRREQGS